MSEAKGISQGSKVSKHGLRASHTADVFLDDCRVPAGYVLGGKDKLDERLARVREGKKGKSQAAMQTFESSRPTVGAQALGIARAAYEYALEYAKEREQFGRKIIENQAIAFTLARMKIEIDAARLLVWRASWMGRNQVPFENAEGSMSKLKAGEVAVWVDRARDPDPRRQRLHARVPRRALAPRREDLRHLRGHRGDPAARDRAGDLGMHIRVGATRPARPRSAGRTPCVETDAANTRPALSTCRQALSIGPPALRTRAHHRVLIEDGVATTWSSAVWAVLARLRSRRRGWRSRSVSVGVG